MPETRDPQLDDLRRRARRRLVGAIVLALAAAVLVPMLLESDPKPLGEDVSVKIPPIDEGRFVSKVGEKAKGQETAGSTKAETPAPVAGSGAASPGTASPKEPATGAAGSATTPGAKSLASAEQRVLAPPAKSASAPPRDAGGGDATKSAEPPAAATRSAAPAGASGKAAPQGGAQESRPSDDAAKSASPKATETAAKTPEPARTGAYSVQLAAFIDDKGANALSGKLKKAGYPAYVEPYATSRGTLWRVRVGPYPSREDAEDARVKLKSDGQNGIITAAK